VSTFQRRNRLRELAANSSKNDFVSPRAPHEDRSLSSLAASAMPIAAALALVGLATAGLFVINSFVPLNLIPLFYVLPVIVAATRWGIAPGLVAALAGAAAADFFFYPPLYSFWLDNRQDVIDLLLYLLVASVASNLAARLKTAADTSNRREREITELHAFSQGLATCLTSRDLIFAVQDYLSNTLKYRAVLIASAPDDYGHDADYTAVPEVVRHEAVKLMTANTSRASTIVAPVTMKAWLVRTIMPEILGYGAIAIELGHGSSDAIGVIAHHVEAVLDEAMVTLKHLKVKEAIEQATINYQTEILRDALVGGVSHELRTPLASILGSCSVLNQIPAIRGDRGSHSLIEAISDQAAQLDRQIRDVLDAARISANGVRPRPVWTDPTDIVDAAVKQKARRLAAHQVVVDLRGDLPLVNVDSVLVEQALGQLLENAAKYSPSGTVITIGSRSEEGYVELSVTDQGGGLTADEKKQLGRRCYRGERNSAVSGSGLGLWIASTFIAANGGSLHAESQGPSLGATLSLRLPTGSENTLELLDTFND
jgi:K+-sensing histidine kinase KdpD